MNKTLLHFKIDFADSEFKSLNMLEDGSLNVFLKSWDAKSIKIIFFNTIQFSYSLNSEIKNIYQINDNVSFLNEALLQEYGKIPDNHPYKYFQIEDIDDFPFIQVVAEEINVSKE